MIESNEKKYLKNSKKILEGYEFFSVEVTNMIIKKFFLENSIFYKDMLIKIEKKKFHKFYAYLFRFKNIFKSRLALSVSFHSTILF